MAKLTTAQKDLLKLAAKGWRLDVRDARFSVWAIAPRGSGDGDRRFIASTVYPLLEYGLLGIEPTGAAMYELTSKGRAFIQERFNV